MWYLWCAGVRLFSTLCSMDALISPRCFNNVCNIEVVNKECQIKACVSQRICTRRCDDDEIGVKSQTKWKSTLHFNSESSADRRICSVRVFVRRPCERPSGVKPVFFVPRLQVKHRSLHAQTRAQPSQLEAWGSHEEPSPTVMCCHRDPVGRHQRASCWKPHLHSDPRA